jgi:hypothetical protein
MACHLACHFWLGLSQHPDCTIAFAMDNQRCTLERKRPSTNVNGSSPAPENPLDGQTLPEIDPFIEYGHATQAEDPDTSDFEESIDKPEEILPTYQTILNINEDKFIFGTLPENPIQRLPGIHMYPKLPPNPRNHYELNRSMLNKRKTPLRTSKSRKAFHK